MYHNTYEEVAPVFSGIGMALRKPDVIRIDDEVWNVIEKNGKFGETPNMVLKRLLKVDKEKKSQ